MVRFVDDSLSFGGVGGGSCSRRRNGGSVGTRRYNNIIMNVIIIYIVLKTSSKIERFLGANGINIVRKVFGVILLAIAVKLFAHNIKALFDIA